MRKRAGWRLWIPIVACLLPWVYNRRNPTLIGIPFFYWSQLLLVPLAAVSALAVILLEDKPAGDGADRK
jgi:hypothetical protein